jgi:hypothetical protein
MNGKLPKHLDPTRSLVSRCALQNSAMLRRQTRENPSRAMRRGADAILGADRSGPLPMPARRTI